MAQKHSCDHIRDRVAREFERLALTEAKHIPWKCLLEAAEDYTEWQVFSLWLRAIVNAARGFPEMVIEEVNLRTPGLLDRSHFTLDAKLRRGARDGTQIWEDV